MARKKRDYGDLPPLPKEKSPYQQRVDDQQEEIKAAPDYVDTSAHLTHLYLEIRAAKDALEEQLSAINLKLEAVTNMMVARFEEEGLDAQRVDGRLVSVYTEPYAQVKDPAAYQRWCIENGLQAKLTMPWQTTNNLVKQMLADGQPQPPGVSVYLASKIRRGPKTD